MTTNANDGTCTSCLNGDHVRHVKALAGICVGCACEWRPPSERLELPIPPTRLYGIPDAEQLYRSAAEAYECQIEPHLATGLLNPDSHDIIEEHNVVPNREHLPSAEAALERVTEHVANSMVDEHGFEAFEQACRAPDVIAAMDHVLHTFAREVNYWMADTVVATHKITWDADGNPHIDGSPLYRKVADA